MSLIDEKTVFLGRKAGEKQEEKRSRGADANASYKYCLRCNEPISDIYHNSYHSHIALKYCEACRKEVKKEQDAKAKERYRKRKMNQKLSERWSEEETNNVIKVTVGELGNAMKKQLKLTEEKCEALEKELLQERAKKGPRTGGNQ